MISTTPNKHRAPVILIALLLLLAGCSSGDDDKKEQADQSGQSSSRTAQIMEMTKRNIDLEKSYSAKLLSDREVVVIARVAGMLEQRHFEPGIWSKRYEPVRH